MNKCPLCIGFLKVYENDYNYESCICLNCSFHYTANEKCINYIEFNYNSIYRIYYYLDSFHICKYDNYNEYFIRVLIFSSETINTSFSGIKEVYNLSIKYIDNMVFL